MLQIVYTPEAREFADLENDFGTVRAVPASTRERLVKNYDKLGARIKLPEAIVVVTPPCMLDKLRKNPLEDLRNPSTTYAPIAVLEQAATILKQTPKSQLQAECQCRALGALLSNPALATSDTLAMRLGMCSVTSQYKHLNKVVAELTDSFGSRKELKNARESLEKAIHALGGLKFIQELKAEYDEKFKKNRVSKEFPLKYPLDQDLLWAYKVSPSGDCEAANYFRKNLALTFQVHLRSDGLDLEKDLDYCMKGLQKHWMGFTQWDQQANATRSGGLKSLLDALPEPKTVVTDTYVVDSYPQLADMSFEVVEFKP